MRFGEKVKVAPCPECFRFAVLFRGPPNKRNKTRKPSPKIVCFNFPPSVLQVHSVLRGILKALDADGSNDVTGGRLAQSRLLLGWVQKKLAVR